MRICKLLEHSRLYCISLKDTLYVPRPCGETLESTARARGEGGGSWRFCFAPLKEQGTS